MGLKKKKPIMPAAGATAKAKKLKRRREVALDDEVETSGKKVKVASSGSTGLARQLEDELSVGAYSSKGSDDSSGSTSSSYNGSSDTAGLPYNQRR